MAERAGTITATGRRKTAVARVRLIPASGTIVVNDRRLDEYFGRPTSRMIVQQPLELTATAANYDVSANVCGGGISAQAAAIRHGISRALVDRQSRSSPGAEKGRLHDPRSSQSRAQEVRSAQGAQAAAVLEALTDRSVALQKEHGPG